MIWIGRLISIAVILQSIESLFVAGWPWSIIADEFPHAVRPLLKSQNALLITRILAAALALVFPHWIPVAILTLTSWLLAWRWRGTFNGGSDAMTMQILLAWLVSMLAPDLEQICACYIAIQLILSYFVAGVAKFMKREWWDGQALNKILAKYGSVGVGSAGSALGFLVMLFEIMSPFAIFRPSPFILGGLVFHLVNAYVLGLNRFFFVWLAAYPALFVLAARLQW